MSRPSPTVSIGMPVYNGERFLRQSIDSILTQTYTDFELTISDNASTDATEKICKDYVSRDPRIRYHRNDRNLGAAKNFNLVFGQSLGRYFRWCSADDLFAPDSLKRCVEVLDGHPEVVLCYPKTILIDEETKVIAPYEDSLDLRFPSASKRVRAILERTRMVNVFFGLVRAEVFGKTRLMRNYKGSDVPLLIEIALHGQFWEISDPLFYRRMHAGASSTFRKESVQQWQYFMDPSTTGKLFLPCWRPYYDSFIAVLRSPLMAGQQMRLTYIIIRSAISRRQELLAELRETLRYLFLRPTQSIAHWMSHK